MTIFNFNHLDSNFFLHLLLHSCSLLILVRGLYYPTYRNRDFAFSYLLFSTVVFFVTYFLKDVEISLGFTFGLFAVFAILRYRTETISTKEMTYLFVVIGLAMLNAVVDLNYPELVLMNVLLVLITYFAQSQLFLKSEYRKSVLYEKIDLLRPEREQDLLRDLEARTGLTISRIEIGAIDFVKDHASIKIFYAPQKTHAQTALGDSYEAIQEV